TVRWRSTRNISTLSANSAETFSGGTMASRFGNFVSYGALLTALGLTAPAAAQTVSSAAAGDLAGTQSSQVEEVVVTARKRDETSIAVPVAITALGAQQIARQNIRSFDDITALTPSLTVSQVSGAIGGTIVMR